MDTMFWASSSRWWLPDPPEKLLDDDLANEARAPGDEDCPVPVEALHGGHGAG